MILILAATPVETSILRAQLQQPEISSCSGYVVFLGRLAHHQIILAHCGIGIANMAIQASRLIGHFTPSQAFLVGCGGSYPDSGLEIGDLAFAEQELYGDLGVMAKQGFIPLANLDLPYDSELMPPPRQNILLDQNLLNQATAILPEARRGIFVTVNCCSGTPELSLDLARRSAGICENMEGAAAAQVCADSSVPLLELRGISNPTGTRDPKRWDIKKGAESAQLAVLKLLEQWPPDKGMQP